MINDTVYFSNCFPINFSNCIQFERSRTIAKNKMSKRWCLCNAMDFQSLMYPNFTWSRILGLFPYKLNALTFEVSKPYLYIYSVNSSYLRAVLRTLHSFTVLLNQK